MAYPEVDATRAVAEVRSQVLRAMRSEIEADFQPNLMGGFLGEGLPVRRLVNAVAPHLIDIGQRGPPAPASVVEARPGIDDGVLEVVQIKHRVFRADSALHLDEPVARETV